MKKFILLLAIVAIAFCSCKKSGDSPGRIDRLEKLIFGTDTLNMYVGETRQVPLTIDPSNYHLDSLKWKSSDTTILSFSNTGLLTAKKTGSSTITVSNLTSTISISALVTVGPAPIDSLAFGLIAYYPFNGSAIDSSGNGYNGINNGATPTPNREGVANYAYSFDGVVDNVRVPDVSALRLNNSDYTITEWINLAQFNSTVASVILCKRSDTQYGYALSITGPAQTRGEGLISFGPGGPYDNFWGTHPIVTGKWYMITIEYSYANKQIKSYINGVFDNESDMSMVSPDPMEDLYIGSDNPVNQTNYYFNGSIDDVRFYSRQLSAHELNVLYNRAY